MTGSGDNILGVSYATASVEAVAAFAAAHYDLCDGPLSCALLNRGFNDTYVLRTSVGESFVLRLSGHRTRGPADVAAETAFLAYLDAEGVPVAAAMPTRSGALFTSARLPGGPRAVVLFRHAEGRRPELDAPEDACSQGVTLAQLHCAAERYPARMAGRYKLDLDHLLHRQVAAVMALQFDAPQARGDLKALATRLADAVGCLDPSLTRTLCHGDCHGLNARISVAEPSRGRAVFFDFDDGGYGYLAYDLAVHLWAQVSFGRRRHAMWLAFLEGYRSVRPVAPADERAVAVFVPIRHIWLMGEYASRTAEWGSEVLSAAWLTRELVFLHAWEQEKLAAGLL